MIPKRQKLEIRMDSGGGSNSRNSLHPLRFVPEPLREVMKDNVNTTLFLAYMVENKLEAQPLPPRRTHFLFTEAPLQKASGHHNKTQKEPGTALKFPTMSKCLLLPRTYH